MIDYVTAAEYASVAVLILYYLFEMKRTGTTIFVLKVYTLGDKILTLLKISRTRQPFVVGFTKLSMDEAFAKLIELGYTTDYLAYFDDLEVISMRICYRVRQVHVRIFGDGEIRMHDEPNYEFDPMAHLKDAPQIPAPERVQAVLALLAPAPETPAPIIEVPSAVVIPVSTK